MFEQAALPIQDQATYGKVQDALGRVFGSVEIHQFLRGLERSGLRARQFEAILAHGLFGKGVSQEYAALGDSDRGHVRESYLRLVETVAPELRVKFRKVYAYY